MLTADECFVVKNLKSWIKSIVNQVCLVRVVFSSSQKVIELNSYIISLASVECKRMTYLCLRLYICSVKSTGVVCNSNHTKFRIVYLDTDVLNTALLVIHNVRCNPLLPGSPLPDLYPIENSSVQWFEHMLWRLFKMNFQWKVPICRFKQAKTQCE